MLDKNGMPLIAMAGNTQIRLIPEMINRHGLITGATGTGKTVSLQTMAETFSAMGIPVFMADVKGDLSGISSAAASGGKVAQRVAELGLADMGYVPRAFPACFWDVFGRNGIPLRTTVSDMGPLLLARVMNLTDVQSGVLQIVFRIADDNGLLLLDLKDLQSMVTHVANEREKYRAAYGQISPASAGAIQRALLGLEAEGASSFFGEPAFDVMDLIRNESGAGVVNILDATTLINSPALYSCVLLWLLSELYERLPEAGDMAKPRLVFFFDEAHLLFDGIPTILLQKIEQVARLIRSKGVGVYFVSQNPADIPDTVLGQLGNRLQHALRAFTPKDQKAVRAAAQAFRPNPAFNAADVIGSLGVGEALVSFLDAGGVPAIVERAFVIPPQSRIGPVSEAERVAITRRSPLEDKYRTSVDRESAYEVLSARARALGTAAQNGQTQKDMTKTAGTARKKASASSDAGADADIGDVLNSVVKQATRSMGNTVGREIGRTILRGLMGSLLGAKK